MTEGQKLCFQKKQETMVQSFRITRRSAGAFFGKAGRMMGLFGLTLLGGCAWQMGETSAPSIMPGKFSAPARTHSGIQLAHAEESQTGGIPLALDHVRCRAAMSAVLAQLTEIERGLAAEFSNGPYCVSANMQCLEQELLMHPHRGAGQ